ncbi:MAG: hypothetical protein HY051_05295 [Candidatus Aenigmarchaeota archaeon]|nr:hypothetical protein [Candidatus Aenigmarchaeota archaeon]
MKGITPVIALTMLVLIATGLTGVAYIWFSGLLTGSSEKVISIPTGGVYCNGPPASMAIIATILNAGASSSIVASDIKVFQVDGTSVAPSIAAPIKPGEAKTVTTSYTCGGTCAGAGHDIRIGTASNVVQTRVICK